MKKLAVILAAVILAALPLSACESSANSVSIFVYDGTDTFISELVTKVTADFSGKLFYGVSDAAGAQSVQNQQIVEAVENGADLLMVNAVDRMACGSIAEKCKAADLPVIFFNREPADGAMVAEKAYYVGSAPDSLGKKQADMAAELFGEDFSQSAYDKNGDGVVQLVILKGEQGHQDAEKRTENCASQMRALGYQIEVLSISSANWQRAEAYNVMQALYGQFGEQIELVFSNNDDMALGAADYLLEKGIFTDGARQDGSQPFVIIGVDGTQPGLDAIERGLIYGTVLNDSTTQADAIALLAEYLLEQKDMSDFPYEITNGHYIYIDGPIILREDIVNSNK